MLRRSNKVWQVVFLNYFEQKRLCDSDLYNITYLCIIQLTILGVVKTRCFDSIKDNMLSHGLQDDQ